MIENALEFRALNQVKEQVDLPPKLHDSSQSFIATLFRYQRVILVNVDVFESLEEFNRLFTNHNIGSCILISDLILA